MNLNKWLKGFERLTRLNTKMKEKFKSILMYLDKVYTWPCLIPIALWTELYLWDSGYELGIAQLIFLIVIGSFNLLLQIGMSFFVLSGFKFISYHVQGSVAKKLYNILERGDFPTGGACTFLAIISMSYWCINCRLERNLSTIESLTICLPKTLFLGFDP